MNTFVEILLSFKNEIIGHMSGSYDIKKSMLSNLISCISGSIENFSTTLMPYSKGQFSDECTMIMNCIKLAVPDYNHYTSIQFVKHLKAGYIKVIDNNINDCGIKVEYYKLLEQYFDSLELELTLILAKPYNKKLQDAIDKYKVLVEQASDGVFITDFEGNYIGIDTKGCQMLGYTRDEILKMNISDLVSSKDLDRVEYEIAALREGHCLINEWDLKRKDGTSIVVEVRTKMLPDGRIQGIMRDLIQREIIDKTLRESVVGFKTLTEATSSYIFICDKTKFLYANPAAERFLGYTSQELSNMNIVDIVHPDFAHVIYECTLTENQNELSPEIYEVVLISKGGEEKWVNVTACAIQIDNQQGILATAFDITDRKKAELELQESEKRYSRLIDLFPDGVFVFDEENCLYVNEAGVKMLGAQSRAELVGKKHLDYVHPDYKDLSQSMIKFCIENMLVPGPLFELKLIDKSGQTLDIETREICFMQNRKPVILSICRDISERKAALENASRLRQVLESDRLKTEFFSNMSHELRTPINVIISALQMCDMMGKNDSISFDRERLRKYLGIMRQNCFRLIKLVNNLIDITKIESGYMQLNLNNYNIVPIVEDIVLSVAEYVKAKGINLIFDTDIEEKVVACDPDKIERIMLNLLSNAVKFTDTGGSITVILMDRPEKIVISVKDTGIGIPESRQKAVFERFVQADMSLSRPSEGSGIGLSLVKSLVELHGGKIYLNSKPGQGSEFVFEIPSAIVPGENNSVKDYRCTQQSKIEKINIEFSDIYS